MKLSLKYIFLIKIIRMESYFLSAVSSASADLKVTDQGRRDITLSWLIP